jgi:peroxiredoxin
MPAAGDVAPDFELPDSTGKPRRLRELFSQRPLVLVFYRGDW